MNRVDKVKNAKIRNRLILLLQSGNAGVDSKGRIVDATKKKVVVQFSEESALSIPPPIKL